jgi:DeoR/GlpR family transcriptional regulator of sugar metabolism
VSHSFLSCFLGPIPYIGTETGNSNQRSNSIVGNPVKRAAYQYEIEKAFLGSAGLTGNYGLEEGVK